jgi:two-component system sensor histidine kinase UhpB
METDGKPSEQPAAEPHKNGVGPSGIRQVEPEAQGCLWLEKEIRNREEQYRILIETMNEGVVIRDAKGLISFVNERFCTLVGYSREELIGRPAEDFLDEENRKVLKEQIARRIKGEQENYDLTLTAKDGREIHTIVSPKPIFDSEGHFRGSFAAIADITRLKKVEAELRESEKRLRLLSSHLLRAQEEEAARISRELHDELGQDLTLLKYQTRFISRKIRKDQGSLKEACEDALQRLDESMEKIRRISRELSPYAIRHLGLTASLRHLLEDFAKHTGTRISLQIANIDTLFPAEAQINLYRIFREALTNIAKHSGADRINAGIVHQNNNVSCWVEDNGKGFDHQDEKAKSLTHMGLGLITMEERAKILGGAFAIESREGAGTRVTLNIPLDTGEGT